MVNEELGEKECPPRTSRLHMSISSLGQVLDMTKVCLILTSTFKTGVYVSLLINITTTAYYLARYSLTYLFAIKALIFFVFLLIISTDLSLTPQALNNLNPVLISHLICTCKSPSLPFDETLICRLEAVIFQYIACVVN